jgi:hypothetical protein
MAFRHRLAVVIACGTRKQAQPAPALYLYSGSYFSACRRWALSVCDPASVYVVSAKYGLVTSDSELEPYDMRLGRRAAMGELVRGQAVLLGLHDRRPVWVRGGGGVSRAAPPRHPGDPRRVLRPAARAGGPGHRRPAQLVHRERGAPAALDGGVMAADGWGWEEFFRVIAASGGPPPGGYDVLSIDHCPWCEGRGRIAVQVSRDRPLLRIVCEVLRPDDRTVPAFARGGRLRRPYDARTLAAAIATCERIARQWDRETHERIKADAGEGDNDDWGEASACMMGARLCARALRRLAGGE